MSEIITEENLASYLQVTIPTGKAAYLVSLVNRMVSEVFDNNPVIPARVEAIALEAAARSYRNPLGVTAETKSIEDWTKTRRWDAANRAGVYLTDEEIAEIQGYRTDAVAPTVARRSIQLSVPGYTR